MLVRDGRYDILRRCTKYEASRWNVVQRPFYFDPKKYIQLNWYLRFSKVQNVVYASIAQEASLLQLYPGSAIQDGIQAWIFLTTIYGTSSGTTFYLCESSSITLMRTLRKFSTTYWILSRCQRKQIESEVDAWSATAKFEFLIYVGKMILKNHKTAPSIWKLLKKIAKVFLSLLSILYKPKHSISF